MPASRCSTRWCSGRLRTAGDEQRGFPEREFPLGGTGRRTKGAHVSGLPDADLIGYLAAALTTAAFVPQAWLSWRTRDLRGVSLGMYSVFTLGIALWLAYGWLLGAWPIVAANAVTLSLALLILGLKLKHSD
jgi:MtN3 and saliva related transmembrane protein